jgi:outer membrane protein
MSMRTTAIGSVYEGRAIGRAPAIAAVRHEKWYAALVGIVLGVVAIMASVAMGQSTIEIVDPAPKASLTQTAEPVDKAEPIPTPVFGQWSQLSDKRLPDGQVELVRLPAPMPPCPAGAPGRIDIEKAVSFALECNPKLKGYQASVMQAAAGKTVAFSPFYPQLGGSTSLAGLSKGIGPLAYQGQEIGNPNNPAGFMMAELSIEWILWDFGRRLGTYCQSELQYDIARCQCRRAEQTVAFKVAEAYNRLLAAYARIKVADESIRRSKDYLRVANDLFEVGKTDKEAVLSAQFDLTQSQQMRVDAESNKWIKTGNLNTQIGRAVLCPVCAIDQTEVPPLDIPLQSCVNLGQRRRPEVSVALDYIAKAGQQKRVAQADFKPTLSAKSGYSELIGDVRGNYFDGVVTLDWDLFTGGKRIGILGEANAAICYARASHREICNQVGYEINEAYQEMISARHNLTLARSAVALAKERYRIVLDKFGVGKAIPTAVIEANTQLTRAEQEEYNSFYNLHIAIARLEYATATLLVVR